MPTVRLFWHRYRVWGLFFLIAFLAFFCFTTSPASWFDEGIYYQVVKNAAAGVGWGVQLAPGVFQEPSLISVGYPVFYPAILLFKLFGESIVTLRIAALLFLFGFVLVFYLLAQTLYGRSAAFWSTLFLVAFSPLYGNGKNFLGEVPGLFYFFLGLLLLTYVPHVAQKKKLLALLGGVMLGLAASAKPVFLLILPAIGIAYLLRLRLPAQPDKEVRRSEARPLLALAGLGVLGALFLFVLTQFGESGGFSGVFAHYANPYYVHNFAPLIFSNAKRFVTETTPIHFLLLLAVAAWFLWKKARTREEIAPAEIAVFAFSLLITASYLRTAGWYRYFFPAHAALFLFLAPGLGLAMSRFGGLFGRWRGAALPVLFSAIVIVQLIPLKSEALKACELDAPTAVAPYLNSLPKDTAVFFYNLPQVAARYSGRNFYQYMKMSDSLVWGKENEALMRQGAFDYLFAAHNIPDEISRIPRCYEFRQNISQILVYKKNLSASCDL